MTFHTNANEYSVGRIIGNCREQGAYPFQARTVVSVIYCPTLYTARKWVTGFLRCNAHGRLDPCRIPDRRPTCLSFDLQWVFAPTISHSRHYEAIRAIQNKWVTLPRDKVSLPHSGMTTSGAKSSIGPLVFNSEIRSPLSSSLLRTADTSYRRSLVAYAKGRVLIAV